MIEPTFSLDSFGQNILYKDYDGSINQIYNLLLMKPGTDILNPDKGCDLMSWYSKSDIPSELGRLEQSITSQISTYTRYSSPKVICKTVSSTNNKKYLHVMVQLYSMAPIADMVLNESNITVKIYNSNNISVSK